jgi:hypothetical protein
MHKEENFEDTIERELLTLSGYHQGNAITHPKPPCSSAKSSTSSKPPSPNNGKNLAAPAPGMPKKS